MLVFFDARHPESGSMRDTLQHLVGKTLSRRDSNKFLYILNQIDNAASEDNTEEVFASWQRALAQIGLTAGTCYAIYIPDVAVPIEDDHIRERFEAKRDAYLAEIFDRIERVGEERAYRIVGMLEETAHVLEQEVVPRIRQFLLSWRRKTLLTDGFIFSSLLIIFLAATIWGEYWDGFSLDLPLFDNLPGGKYTLYGIFGVLILGAVYIHVSVRQWASKSLIGKFTKKIEDPDSILNYARAFGKNSAWYQSIFRRQPIGWSKRSKQRLANIMDNSNAYIQKLNDMYTNPSGDKTYMPVMGSQCADDTIETGTSDEPSDASREKEQAN